MQTPTEKSEGEDGTKQDWEGNIPGGAAQECVNQRCFKGAVLKLLDE